MYRFKIQTKDKESFLITGEELHHLIHVLRLTSGDKVVGYDNSGTEWLGVIESLEIDAVCCKILEEQFPEVEARTKVYLVMGLAKGEKMEWVIQKGTEIGMAGFVPLRTQRSVVQLEGKKAHERVGRWQKIAAEAVKQSRRVVEPKVEGVADWRDLNNILPSDTQWLIPYEDEKKSSLSNTLQCFSPEYPIAILIGPEGGFTPEEAVKARERLKAHSVTLGPRILRTETAALAALVMVLSHFGDLG